MRPPWATHEATAKHRGAADSLPTASTREGDRGQSREATAVAVPSAACTSRPGPHNAETSPSFCLLANTRPRSLHSLKPLTEHFTSSHTELCPSHPLVRSPVSPSAQRWDCPAQQGLDRPAPPRGAQRGAREPRGSREGQRPAARAQGFGPRDRGPRMSHTSRPTNINWRRPAPSETERPMSSALRGMCQVAGKIQK